MLELFRNGKFSSWIAQAVVGIYLHSMVVTPLWADAITNSAAEGRTTGEALSPQQFLPSTNGSSGATLFPDSNKPIQVELKDLFPGADAGSINDYENTYGNDANTVNAGVAANKQLSTDNSGTGQAYQTLNRQSAATRPNMSNDPIVRNSGGVLNTLDVFKKQFTDCSTETTISESSAMGHIPSYKTCEKINKPEGNYTLQHSYAFTLPIEPHDGEAMTDSCGEGCMYLYLGKIGNNYLAGNCTVFEFAGSVKVNRPAAIASATLEFVKWDDYIQVFLGDTKIWNGPNNSFPPETGGGDCELKTEWEASPNTEVTEFFKVQGLVPFKIRVSVGGNGEGYARVKIHYDPTPMPVEDKWYSTEAVSAANSVTDGFCSGSNLQCVDMPALDANGCANVNGVTVCPTSVQPSPYPGLNPLCRKATFTTQCDFNEGQMSCYTDAKGNNVCPVNGGNTCVVSHALDIQESVANVKLAAMGKDLAIFDFDLANGTWSKRPESDGQQFAGQVDKVDYNTQCGAQNGGDPVPNGSSGWSGFPWSGYVDNTVNVTVLQQPTCANGLKGVAKIQDTESTPATDAALTVALKYKSINIRNEEWGHSSCVEAAQKVGTAACPSGKITVTKGPTSGSCTTISGMQVCRGDSIYNRMQASPIAGIDKLVEEVRVDGCIAAPAQNDSCAVLQSNPSCGFISSSCVDGAGGKSGNCYVQEQKWDCGTDVALPNYKKTDAIQCGGEIRCLGGECGAQKSSTSPDFAQALAALQVAQFAGHDLDCANASGSNCTIFKGEAKECKKAVGGWVNCCDQPSMVSLADYVTLTMNTYRVMEATGNFQATQAVYGQWSALKQPVLDAWGSVTKSFSSAADSLTGTATDVASEAGQSAVIEQVEQQMMKKAAEWTAQTFGEGAANAIFTTTTSTTTTTAADGTTTSTTTTSTVGFNSTLASAASVIMWAYTIYVIADLLINIIYECEPAEFELAAKKEVKTCHHIGSYCAQKALGACVEKRESYCCFNSPVARILQEQIREQIGPSWGSPESPNCAGVGVADMKHIDWGKVDLTEWLSILKITGNYPTPNMMNIENLTGSGSALNANGTRENSATRTQERIDGVDAAELRERAAHQLQ